MSQPEPHIIGKACTARAHQRERDQDCHDHARNPPRGGRQEDGKQPQEGSDGQKDRGGQCGVPGVHYFIGVRVPFSLAVCGEDVVAGQLAGDQMCRRRGQTLALVDGS